MGTRADFYVGTGKSAEWIGSVSWDGYEWHENPEHPIMQATDEDSYRAKVAKEFAGRDDSTTPDKGWPWPWADSCTTDYSYCFENGKVTAYSWGAPILEDEDDPPEIEWPDMSACKNVQIGGKRSGIIVVSA